MRASSPGFAVRARARARARVNRGNRLLVADGLNGTVDVYDADFQLVDDPGLFVDPKIAKTGLVPYNVAFLKDRVYVAYADPEGAHRGAISMFKADGKFKKRLFTDGDGGVLQGPWGMAIAPKHWGKFGGRLLVGNVENGRSMPSEPAAGSSRAP